MTETPDRTESIFAAAVALADAAGRAVYLDQACADDAALRGHVEALLRAHERAGHLLDRPVPGSPRRIGDPDQTGAYMPGEQPGAVIAGRYKLLEAIGEGGMGTVWVAEQSQPVKRKVALKLIKAGMDSKSVLARFEAERQALAVMDHPNIAKVLDGGLTETARPYFVMEYVKGVPITEFCDATRMSIPERLNLFAQVCAAVQHAHQKGIIHRDLKPSNILVAPYDDKPVPKVIDFGLAKAMHQSLTERTLHTAHETVLGTPLYMSPEQAQLNNLDVDTRSDIYSLGVLLYELLTGTTPLEKKRFKEAAWDEIKRIIREEEPPRPSTRLSSSEALPSLAAGRHTEPVRLTKLVRGELDWIVMRSLEKDRTRRYETANGFALDIQRYLAGEPVLAAPPSARYRLRKFARKHRAPLTTAAAMALLLVAGVAVSTWQAVRATRAEQAATAAGLAEAERAKGERMAKVDALAQKTAAEQAAAQETAANAQAQKRLAQIEKANDILGSIFENLDPKEVAKAERPLQTILVEKLDQAVAQLEGESIGDPLLVAAMQGKLGKSLLGLGEAAKAIVLLEKARDTFQAEFGPEHPDTLSGMGNLALAYLTAGKLDLAVPLLEETLAFSKGKLGPEHPDTLIFMGNLAAAYQDAGKLDLALPVLEETLALKKSEFGPEHPDTLIAMNNLASAYRATGMVDLALPLFEETFALMKAKLGPEHPHTLNCMCNLALANQAAGKLDLALPLFEETLALSKAKLGPEHPDTLASMNNLAWAYEASGKLDLALPLFEETLKLCKAKLGPEHPNTLSSMNNLAGAYQDAGKLDLALPLLEETVALSKAKLGSEHPDVLTSMGNLGKAYKDAGKLELALPHLEESLALKKAKLGPEHPDTLISMINLASAYQAAGKLDLALPLFEETLKLSKAKLGPEHPHTLTTMNNLATAYRVAGKLDLALPLLEETLALRKAKLGAEHPQTVGSMGNLGKAYCDANQGEKAVATLKGFVASWRKRLKPDDPQFAGMLAQVALDLLKCRQHGAADELLRECLAIREKTQPDEWTTFNTQSMLGEALVGQEKYAEAEPLLLAGYEGLNEREAKIPQQGKVRIPEALQRLVDFYTATGQAEKADEWRAKLEAAQPNGPEAQP